MVFISNNNNNNKKDSKGAFFFPNFCTDIDKKRRIYTLKKKNISGKFFLFLLFYPPSIFNLLIGLVKPPKSFV